MTNPNKTSRLARVLPLLAIGVALFAATASSGENEPKKADEGAGASEATDPAAAPDEFAVGDLVELGDWQVKVHGVTDPFTSDDPIFQPAAGNRWVAIDVEVTNTGDSAETLSSIVCFQLKDGENKAYDSTVTGVAGTASPDGDLAPGASLRGTLEYELPTAAAGLHLTFNCDLLDSGSATIALG
jgi:hypothetical protein